MSSGFEIAVAAFEPEATAWSRLRTTLARRSNAATLFRERDWRMIRSFDPTGYPAPRPIAATPVSITPPLRVLRTARPARIRFMPEPEVSLDFSRLGPLQKGGADLGQPRCGLVFSATACGEEIARVPWACWPRVVASFALTPFRGRARSAAAQPRFSCSARFKFSCGREKGNATIEREDGDMTLVR